MLYAKFMYPDNGYDCDIEQAKIANLKVGERYEVEMVDMGRFHTSIYLKNIDGDFNSVQFEFEEYDGTAVDIFSDPQYFQKR